MKLSDFTREQLEVAYSELCCSRDHLIARAFGDFEQAFLERADLLQIVIDAFREALSDPYFCSQCNSSECDKSCS